jgi:hypothetical protein
MNTIPRYVTIAMIARHVGRHEVSIRRSLHLAGLMPPKIPGACGYRLTERAANLYILKHFPEAGPIQLPAASVAR